MSLDNGAQVILQSEMPGGGMSCVGFTGLPLVNPAFISLVHADSPEARANADVLRQELEREILALDPGARKVAVSCHAQQEPSCRNLLVLVGDDKTPIASRASFEAWRSGDLLSAVLPVLPQPAKTAFSALIPKEFHACNGEFWSRSVTESIPAVLALAGLTSDRPRIFISYRQKESAALAMQLFDALSHENFDVFLDHYRIDPGVDFQARLTQELGDKAMVLLIESAGILDSQWTLYEINVAKECGLGIFALHPPGGKDVPGVDEAVRERLHDVDFVEEAFSAMAVLGDLTLANVIDRVKREHDRALVRRRRVLRNSLEDALLLQGVSSYSYDQHGILHVSRPGNQEYRVWVTPRPPEIEDFHLTQLRCQAPARGIVIGLSRLMEPPRMRRTDWLADLCHFRMIDEGRLKDVAAEIARGAL